MSLAASLILLAPLGALAVGFFVLHRRAPRWTHWPILASCVLATASAWWLAAELYAGNAAFDQSYWTWIAAGETVVEFGLRVDGLGAAVLAMVTLVSTLIHAYAVGYMREDPGFSRFFLFFHLFLFSMLGLLLSNNLLQLYLFWEGVGLASYLLIGFWYDRETARRAALKAFVVNRVGDACFLFALFILARDAQTLRFTELYARLALVEPQSIAWASGLLFLGACAKSAQFPLYVWLPDAMEGPTPTSALMHAATMVTAGVFLMMRCWPLLERAPQVLSWIAATGAFTAVLGAVLAATKKDLKRILAYSTVSHLGLMTLALGCGNVYAAALHLIMHGFFKATLFCAAGNVLHALGKSSATVDEAGGLAGELRLTYFSFAFAGAALAGLPPLSGFFSKDLVLEAALHRSPWLGACASLVAVGSGFYIGRLFWLAFAGPRPEQKRPHGHGAREAASQPGTHGHHGDAWLERPVAALAALAALAGVVAPTGVAYRLITAAPLWSGRPFPEPHLDWQVAAAGTALAGLGLWAAWLATMAKPSWDWAWRRNHPVLESWFDADFGFQPLARGLGGAAQRLGSGVGLGFDLKVWDRFVEGTADSFIGLSEGLSGLSRGLLNEYLWWMAAGTSLLLVGLAWTP